MIQLDEHIFQLGASNTNYIVNESLLGKTFGFALTQKSASRPFGCSNDKTNTTSLKKTLHRAGHKARKAFQKGNPIRTWHIVASLIPLAPLSLVGFSM